MKRDFSGGVNLAAVLVLGLSALVATGCGILDEGGTPEQARVILEGGEGQGYQLVVSNDFAIVSSDDGETRDIFFYSADTSSVSGSLNQRYSLGSGVRIYVKAYTEEALGQPVTMRVLIDGEQRFNGTSTLGGEDLEFLYSFR
jgi:hypothetical protein